MHWNEKSGFTRVKNHLKTAKFKSKREKKLEELVEIHLLK